MTSSDRISGVRSGHFLNRTRGASRYGLMYLVGFIFAMWLATRRANRPGSGWTKNEVENLLYAGFLGVSSGTYWLCSVHNFPQLMAIPLYLFRVWDGGCLPRRPDWRYRGDDYLCPPY
ncbi:prolipoprotein diacylglyceryl transferase family protein [Shigella flexneri]